MENANLKAFLEVGNQGHVCDEKGSAMDCVDALIGGGFGGW